MNNQEIKADAGKPCLSLVPKELMIYVAYVREYGVAKYGDKECWRDVKPERYVDAMGRHMLCVLEDIHSIDEESQLPHLWHALANGAFLAALIDFDIVKTLNDMHNVINSFIKDGDSNG